MDGKLGAIPERGSGGSGENCPDADALVLDLVVKGLRETDDKSLGTAVDAVEQFGAESDDR